MSGSEGRATGKEAVSENWRFERCFAFSFLACDLEKAYKQILQIKQGVWMALFGVPSEVLESITSYYQSAGLDAELLPKDSKETIGGSPSIKMKGKKFDLIQVKFVRGSMHSMRGGFLGPSIRKKVQKSYPVLGFNYIVRRLGAKSEKDVEADLKKKTSGLFTKKLLDVEWRGGRLARLLNSDADLKRKIMKSGVADLKVKADKKNDCIRIVHQKKIAVVSEMKGLGFGKYKTRAENLPPMEAVEICDKIAAHVKSI